MNKIQIIGVPYVFPSSDFAGVLYFEDRLIKLPESKFKIIETQEAFSSSRDGLNPAFVNQAIQALKVDRYKAFIYCNELADLELLKCSPSVLFTCDDGRTVRGKVAAVTYDSIAEGTYLYRASVEIHELSNDRDSVINFLTYPGCLGSPPDAAHIHQLQFYSDALANQENQWGDQSPSVYFTCLNPIFETSEAEVKESDATGVKILSQSIDFDVIRLRFYLTTLEAKEVKKYLYRCWWIDETTGLPVGTKIVLADGTEYQAVERVIPKFTDKAELIDVVECEISLKYAKTVINHFVNS